MTSLANQLKQLALPGTNVEVELKKRHSLLFDSQKASTLDRDTLYGLGVNGFEGLCSNDPSLYDDFITLFDENAKGVERSVLMKKDHALLDGTIKKFLLRVTPYFLSRSLLKCLEWLIYRFRIHHFNAVDMLVSFLPYHRTKLYARLLQLFDLNVLNKEWCWVGVVREEDAIPTLSMMSEHCMRDRGFFALICNTVSESIKAYGNPKNVVGSQPAISFYATCTLDVIFKIKGERNEFLAQIMPSIVKGLESSVVNYKACTYMIICGIASNMELRGRIIFSLLELMSKNYDKRLAMEHLITVIALCQMQENSEGLPENCLEWFCATPNTWELLQLFADTYDVGDFLLMLVKQLVLRASNIDGSEKQTEMLKEALMRILQSFSISMNLQNSVIFTLLHEFCNSGDNMRRWLLKPILCVEKKYPQIFYDVITRLRKNDDADLKAFTTLSLEIVKNEDCVITSFPFALELCHPLPDFRISAITNLSEMINSNSKLVETDSVRDAIKARILEDDSPEVLLSALEFVKKHPRTLFHDIEETSKVLIDLVYNKRSDSDWSKISEAALELLLDNHSLDAKDGTYWKIMFVICDMLLQSVCSAVGVASSVLATPVLRENQWLLSFGKKKDINSMILSMVDIIKKQPDVFLHLRNAGNHLLNACLKKQDSPGLSPRSPFYLLLNYAGLNAFLDENTPALDFETTASVQEDIIRDLKMLLSTAPELKSSQPELAASKRIDDSSAFGRRLVDFVDVFHGSKRKDECVPLNVDIMFSLLFCSLKLMKKWDDNSEIFCWADLSTSENTGALSIRVVRCKLMDFVLEVLPFTTVVPGMYARLKEVLKFFFANYFPSPEAAVCFLSQYWSSRTRDSTRVHVSVQALCLATAVIEKNGVNVTKLLSAECLFVPCLLVAVSSKTESVRRAALECLARINISEKEGLFIDLVRNIVEHTDMLVADSESLPAVFSSFFILKKKVGRTKSRTEHSNITALNALLHQQILQPATPPLVRVALLQGLRMVNSKSLCRLLIPLLEDALDRVCQGSSLDSGEENGVHISSLFRSLLSRIDGEFLIEPDMKSVFYKAVKCNMKISHELNNDVTPQSICLGLMNKNFFTAVDDETQYDLIKMLLDLPLKNSNALETVRKVLKSVSLSSRHIHEEVEEFVRSSKTLELVPEKRRKTNDSGDLHLAHPSFSDKIRRMILLLELLQQKKKIANQQTLFAPLFRLLELTFDVSLHQRDDYMRQLLLTILLKLLQRLKSSQRNEKELSQIISNTCKIEVIVHCVHLTDNTQTQHLALLLLSEIASLYPEKVLHNVMSIFTFMGSHMLGKDDPYSFQIINTTMQAILPALASADFGGKSDKHLTILNIIHAFVDAVPHMPSHRKIAILSDMLKTLGGHSYLWLLLIVLVSTGVRKPAAQEQQSQIERHDLSRDGMPFDATVQICGSLCDLYTLEEQMQSLLQCLEYILTLPLEEHQIMGKPKAAIDVIDASKLTVSELRRFLVVTLAVFSHVIERNKERFTLSLKNNVNSMALNGQSIGNPSSDFGYGALTALLQRFYKELFTLIHRVNTQITSSTKPPGKFFKVLLARIYDIISQVNLVLPFKVMLEIVDSLLDSRCLFVKRKSLELLAGRLSSSTNFSKEEVSAIAAISEKLAQLALQNLHEEDATAKSPDQLILSYTALVTLKVAVRACGKLKPDCFTGVLSTLCQIVSAPHLKDNQGLSASLLCLAEMCSCLKAYCIPYLNSFVPTLLERTCNSHTLENENLLFSCVTVIHRLLENLSNFTSSYLEDVIEKIASLMLLKKYREQKLHQAESTSISARIGLRINAIIVIIATKLSPRLLITAISSCERKAGNVTPVAFTKPLCILLLKHIEVLDKAAITQCSAVLFPLLYKILEFRCGVVENFDTMEIVEVEECSTEMTAAALLKLPENLFRTYFFKLLDWASTASDQQSRLITYCKLLLKLSKKMKGLFSLFAGGILDSLGDALRKNTMDDSYKKNEEQELLVLICDTLCSILSHDTSGLLTKERFEQILHPLIDQIEIIALSHDTSNCENAEYLLLHHVIPCAVQLAGSVNDESCRKLLNYKLCSKSRSSSSKVRFFSLKALEAVAQKLSKDYIVLLPETIPFLSELMEDDVEDVEVECHRVVKSIEKVVEEPLQKYFLT